jgi:tetratricopeptide (TPR) repeat protein
MSTLLTNIKTNITILIENGKFDAAEELINEYIQFQPDDFDMFSIRSVLEMMQHNWERAMEIVLQGLSINKDDFDLLFNLGYIYEQKSDWENSIRYYIEAQKINENDQELNYKIVELKSKTD